MTRPSAPESYLSMSFSGKNKTKNPFCTKALTWSVSQIFLNLNKETMQNLEYFIFVLLVITFLSHNLPQFFKILKCSDVYEVQMKKKNPRFVGCIQWGTRRCVMIGKEWGREEG